MFIDLTHAKLMTSIAQFAAEEAAAQTSSLVI
jgi:hypothetical protein